MKILWQKEENLKLTLYKGIELYESGLHINGVFGAIPDMEFHKVIEDDTIITSTTPFLNRNVLYLGDLTIDAIVNVSNSNLVVLGTLNVENNGNLTVSNGNIYVGDDFRIQSRNIDGSFGETNGRVNITGLGRVTVLGDFYAQITNSLNVGNSGAILELYGNFYQVGTNTFFRGLDGFTVVFSGDEQRVSFDRFDANATLYRISGANGSRRVIFDTPVWQIIPTENTTIFGDSVTFNTIRHSDYVVNIYGDFIARTAGSIQSELIVNGSFYATNGFVTSQADITVKQDLRHQAINEDGTYGITNAALSMSPGRTVTVHGDFYSQSTAGAFSGSATLELHGDFHQIGTDTRFVPQDFFTLAFAGSEQRVSFDRFDNNATLARISGADESRKVYFDTPVWRIIPTENAVIYGDSVTINIIGNSNYTVTINGDFVARTAATIQSELVVNGSFYATNGIVTSQVDITVKQDLRHQSINEDGTYGITNGALSLNPGRKVTVLGNFYSQSTAGFFSSAATMELHGNFSQIGTDTRFAPMHSFNLVFAGTEHRVSFDRHDSNAILRGVSGANGQRRVYLDTPIHAVWLAEDSVFHGDSSVTFLHPDWNTAKFMGSLENLREIQNGDLYIHGDFESVYSTLIGNGSTVIVNGNVYLHNGLWLGNPTSRLSVRGNMINGLGTSRVSTVRVNAGGLLDLRGDYIQPDSNEGVIESSSISRVQLSGNSTQRIVFPAGRRVHLHNLHIRNQPSGYTISNGLNTYSFADAIADQPNSPRIWTNLLFDIEEVTIPNIPLPDDDDEEFDLPNNTGMLAWPANSGEVTLWFGIVDEFFFVEHSGLDIQDEIDAPVYSISNGIVTDIYSDPFYGNVVAIDFLYYGELKQAKYNHMDMVEVAIGETVSKGQTIGTMSTHESVDRGLLELRLYKEDVPIDPFPLMERPDYDESYLSFPMAFSKDTSPIALQAAGFDLSRSVLNYAGNSLSDLEKHKRFMGNLDLEQGEEVYLRKWAYDFVINRSGYITPEEFEERRILTWCEASNTATFEYDDVFFRVVIQQDIAVVNHSMAMPSNDFIMHSWQGRQVNDRIVIPNVHITFSAFSIGTNLFNIAEDSIAFEEGATRATRNRLRRNFRNARDSFTPINPAEDFVMRMRQSERALLFVLDRFGLNYTAANTGANIINPTKLQVLRAMETSDIVYIATHGFRDVGLGVQHIVNPSRPTIFQGNAGSDGAEFVGTRIYSEQHIIDPRVDFDGRNVNMKWLILSACAQLDYPGLASYWANALLRDNDVHGILGYYGLGPGHIRQNETNRRFFQYANEHSLVYSWERANERRSSLDFFTNRNWAVLVNEDNRDDRLHRMPNSSSNDGNDRIIRRYSFYQDGSIIIPTTTQFHTYSVSDVASNGSDGIMDYFRRSANGNVNVEFDFISEYEFSFEKAGHSLEESEQFHISQTEISELALQYLIALSPISDLYIASIGYVTRRIMNPDGTAGHPEILKCEIIAIPKINGLPVYSHDMFLRIEFDNSGIIRAESNLPTNTDDFNINRSNADDFPAYVLQEIILTDLNEYNEVKYAYYLTENNELIATYIVKCSTSEDVLFFRADTGESIAF